jgi:hypothetical protein
MDFIDTMGERVQAIRNGNTPGAYIKQRIQQAAEQLSNSALIQMQLEAISEAVLKYTSTLYERVDGYPVNIDKLTHRVRMVAPWGSAGWKTWGLRHWEACVLRSILLKRSRQSNALFEYNEPMKTWHVNVRTYTNSRKALEYWQAHPIRVEEWMDAMRLHNAGRVTATTQSRQRKRAVKAR